MTIPGAVLAIDAGKKRMGLAVSDEERMMALPLETYVVERGADPIDHLIKVCADRDVNQLVFGLPRHLNGTEGEMAAWVRQLAGRFSERSQIPVAFLDERLTSKIAANNLKANGVQPSRNKSWIDSEAARLLLEDYLASL